MSTATAEVKMTVYANLDDPDMQTFPSPDAAIIEKQVRAMNWQNAQQRLEATPMQSDWPFKDAENLAVISLTRITDGSKPILYVVHDEEGDWQFLDGGDVSEEDSTMMSLKRVVELDPSIKTLADLPDGWGAERASVDKPWKRFER